MSNKRVNPFKLKLHLLECEADEKDQKISDLEARLAENKEQLIDMNEKSNKIKKESYYLKQQLHELPKKIVEDIKIQMGSIEDILINCGNGKEDALSWFNECLDSILKKYGGEDE